MSNPIILPPLPEPAGTLVPPAMTAGSSWYSHGYTADQLRARDLEVARVVLEGAKGALVQASIEAKRGTDRAVLTAAAIIVRALEVRHHE